MDVCVSCKKEVTAEDKAMECDLCDKWEHVGCLRHSDKLTDELYDPLTKRQSKAILHVCSQCRTKGTISQIVCTCQSLNLHVSKKLDMKNGWPVHNVSTDLTPLVFELRDEKTLSIPD